MLCECENMYSGCLSSSKGLGIDSGMASGTIAYSTGEKKENWSVCVHIARGLYSKWECFCCTVETNSVSVHAHVHGTSCRCDLFAIIKSTFMYNGHIVSSEA